VMRGWTGEVIGGLTSQEQKALEPDTRTGELHGDSNGEAAKQQKSEGNRMETRARE